MIKFVYALYDKEFGTFNDPTFSALDQKAFVNDISIALRSADPSKITPQVRASTFYYIGTFDTDSGSLVSETPLPLVRIRDILRRIELSDKEEDEIDGK